MKVRMTTLEIDTERHTGGDIMSDWIDNFKKQTKGREENKARQEDIRLHKSKIIRAKLPKLWDILVDRIKIDCAKLTKMFPDENQYHCDIEVSGDSFRLTCGKHPFRTLYVELNLDGQCIDILEGFKNETALGKVTQIQIDTFNDESLLLKYRGKDHKMPETLSQQLISIVCEIN
jgi:hypothetical protein